MSCICTLKCLQITCGTWPKKNVKAYIHGRSTHQVAPSSIMYGFVAGNWNFMFCCCCRCLLSFSLLQNSSFMRFSNFLIYCLGNMYMIPLAHCYGYFTLRLNITIFFFVCDIRYTWSFLVWCSFSHSVCCFFSWVLFLIHSEKWDMILIYLRARTDIHVHTSRLESKTNGVKWIKTIYLYNGYLVHMLNCCVFLFLSFCNGMGW